MMVDGQLAGKIAVVADAPGMVGRALAQAFAESGAHVILVGLHEGRLMEIAQTCPEAVETVSLARGRATVLDALRDAWGGEPLDFYVDLLPFSDPGEDHPGEAISRSAGLLSALATGLRNAAGIGVLALPGGAERATAPMAGFRGLIADQACRLQPACLTGLIVRDMQPTMTMTPATAGLLANRLFHLVRGDRPRLQTGAVYDWSPLAQEPGQADDEHGKDV